MEPLGTTLARLWNWLGRLWATFWLHLKEKSIQKIDVAIDAKGIVNNVELPCLLLPASENLNLVIYLSRGGSDSRTEIEEAIKAEGAQEGGGPRRYMTRGYTRNGDPAGGSTATIERGEAEAIQETGIPRGQYGDNRERRSRVYTRNGGPEGRSTTKIEGGEV